MIDASFLDSGVLEWIGAILINFGVHSSIALGVALGLSSLLRSPHLRASALRWGAALPLLTLPTLWVVSQPSGPGGSVPATILESPIFVGVTEASAAGFPLIPLLVLGWAVVAGVRFLSFLGKVAQEWLRGSRGSPMDGESLAQLERHLAGPLKSQLRQLPLRQLPPGEAAYCSVRGEICIPEDVIEVLNPEEFAALLGHELGHIKGGDLRAHLGLQLMERLFFFQPLLWWVSRRHAHLIEEAADAYCVHLTQDPLSLAGALKTLAELSLGHRPRVASLGIGGPSPLMKRVDAIFRASSTLPSRKQRTLMALGWALLLMGVMSLPSVKAHDLPQIESDSQGMLDEEEPGLEGARVEPEEGAKEGEGESTSTGASSAEKVKEAVDRCFAKYGPKVAGHLTLSVTVYSNGHVAEAEVVEGSLDEGELHLCLEGALMMTVFPPHEGEPLQLLIPFVYHP